MLWLQDCASISVFSLPCVQNKICWRLHRFHWTLPSAWPIRPISTVASVCASQSLAIGCPGNGTAGQSLQGWKVPFGVCQVTEAGRWFINPLPGRWAGHQKCPPTYMSRMKILGFPTSPVGVAVSHSHLVTSLRTDPKLSLLVMERNLFSSPASFLFILKNFAEEQLSNFLVAEPL